jgi:hypothetical protein
MNHPLWPVVREAARRIVRLENLEIHTPNEFIDSINELSSKISDHIPQRTNFPKHIVTEENAIKIYEKTGKKNKLIIEVSMFEPDIDVCWVQMTKENGFNAIIESCLQLLEAGYPGCIGCDDSIQEGRWDERKFRNSLKQKSK